MTFVDLQFLIVPLVSSNFCYIGPVSDCSFGILKLLLYWSSLCSLMLKSTLSYIYLSSFDVGVVLLVLFWTSLSSHILVYIIYSNIG
jgi:hypothetical protein